VSTESLAHVDPVELRERLRWLEYFAIADAAPDERRAEAMRAAMRAFDTNLPACVFRLQFHHAMHTAQPFTS